MTRPTLAVGPEAPEFGSWNWIGADLLDGPIAQSWSVSSFADPNHPPTADVIVFLKFLPSSERLRPRCDSRRGHSAGSTVRR